VRRAWAGVAQNVFVTAQLDYSLAGAERDVGAAVPATPHASAGRAQFELGNAAIRMNTHK
jgi:hypothetical protein